MSGIDRFKVAQDAPDGGFDAALREIRAGGKTGHWIWYIFPQLAGLGRSSTARVFGIDGRAEAVAYLRDPVLRARLLTITSAVAEQLRAGQSLRELMGSGIDAQKLVSSLTLFGHVARTLDTQEGLADCQALAAAADDVLAAAAAEGYPPCVFTLEQLER